MDLRLAFRVLIGCGLFLGPLPAATVNDFTFEASPSLDNGTVPYRLYKAQGYDLPANATRQYPLIMWLHGIGEKGTNNTSQMGNGVVNLANDTNQAYQPAFVMVPQAPTSSGDWCGGETRGDTYLTEKRVMAAIEDLKARFRIDPDRIYVMGLSWGGSGSWNYGNLYPDVFAAIAPMSLGGSDGVLQKSLLAPMPIWSFCGANDTQYKPQNDAAVATVRQAGGRPIYTVYTGEGHSADVWGTAAGNLDFYKWLMAQRRLQFPVDNPLLRIQSPSTSQGYATGGASVALSGTAALASPTLTAFNSIVYSNNGGGSAAVTGTTSWSTPSIPLAGGPNFIQVLATAQTAATAAVPAGGITTFNDALVVNDTTAPVLAVLNPTPGATYTSPSDFLTIRGWASDNRAVTRIDWANDRGGVGRAGAEFDNMVSGQVNWIMRRIPLQKGHNVITITAYDLAGNTAAHTLDVFRSPSRGGDFFRQDFSGLASPGAYVSTSKNPPPNTLHDISASSGNDVWSVTGGALQIARNGGAGNSAGFLRRYAMDGPPDGVMAVSFDLRIDPGIPGSFTNLAILGVGLHFGMNSGLDGTGWSAINTELAINDAGTNKFTFKVNSTGANTTFNSDGTWRHVTWFINSTTVTRSYQAPDGTMQTVEPNCSAVWVGSTRVIDNALKNSGYGSQSLSHFRFQMTGSNPLTLQVDNLACSDFTVPTPYGTWLETAFTPAELADGAVSREGADPDGDGVANLLEYALGSLPTNAGSAAMPVAALVSDHLQISFNRIEPADVTYVVEASDGLASWTPIATLAAGTPSWSGTAVVNESGTGGTRSVVVTDPAASGQAARFLRLRVSYP